jgi:hypothetical protein
MLIYHLSLMCEPNVAILGCMAMDNLFLSQENDLNLRKQVDHANEVKVMSSMHG